MPRIGIIGAGFSGTMTAVNLIRKTTEPVEIFIFDKQDNFNKGIAYNPYSERFILNVIASKMSAFAEDPEHFLNWVLTQEHFKEAERSIVAEAFLPRYIYGKYLEEVWKNAVASENAKKSIIREIDALVENLDTTEGSWFLTLSNGQKVTLDICVIATGNNIPQNPDIKNAGIFQTKHYFQNPWDKKSVMQCDRLKSILLIGNGLTMVDTVFGLLEQGYTGEIYTLSRNGFHTIPHRHIGFRYSGLVNELPGTDSLSGLVNLIHKHIKYLEECGFSAEPVIDSLRPFTQDIWQKMSDREKYLFTFRLRYLWDAIRHRIPFPIKEKIQKFRLDNKLHICTGKLIGLSEQNDIICVSFYDMTMKTKREIQVARVINCSGPATDIRHLENSFLKDCLVKRIISQDTLKLGINADAITFQVFDNHGLRHNNLFTIGPTLKGVLWESVAVNELRDQANKLAEYILQNHVNQ
jgi:uncharacterized NAD(P)/FAD-binding protein YdhS